ncbi:hypothetical protein B0H14DRAFT_2368041, partial [Mycena olivaceomarginata]
NRMRGPLYLFESVINSLWFLRTSVILFLNKIDVFKRNIVSRPSSSPRGNNVNIAGARRGARSGDCAGDECCGIQHAVLAPRPTRARVGIFATRSMFVLASVGGDGERRTLHPRDGASRILATYINTFEIQI